MTVIAEIIAQYIWRETLCIIAIFLIGILEVGTTIVP